MHTSSTQRNNLRQNRAANRLAARIGGISLGLTSGPGGPALGPDHDLRQFLVDATRCDLEFEVAYSDDLGSPRGELIFDSGGLWKLYRDSAAYCFRFATPYLGPRPYKQARVSRDFTQGRIELARRCFAPELPLNPLEYPLDELLWIHRLSQGEGVEVHGCGVIAPDGRGLLLTGHSGAGKSTSARLWSQRAGARVLSDDRIILRRERGRVWMYGTPWHGDAGIAQAERWPLDGIYVLAHGHRNTLLPLRCTTASAELFARSFVPHHSPDAVAFILEFFSKVTACVPCHVFSFVPDFTAVEALLSEANGKIIAA
ncbi:MAG: hypothetical protein WA192_02935 [Candidatus Acidiferrales bacterium]